LLAAVLRVQLNDAERLALRGTQRHAHHRADAEIDDTLAELNAVVAAGVIAEKRLRRLQATANDGPAGPGVSLLIRPPGLDNARQQAGGAFLGLNDKTAVGLAEELKQTLDDLGHQGIEIEGLAEVGADVEQTAEFLGRLRLQEQVAALVEHDLDGG